MKVYYLPLLESNLATEETLQGIFSNIESIASIHTPICALLESISLSNTLDIIQCFDQHVCHGMNLDM